MKEPILIVEDDPDIAESVRYNLQREGFKTQVAESGERGYQIAVESGAAPALIVLDLMLPGMSGMELCKRLRREVLTEKTPIIILTAKASETDKLLGLELGADDYMIKPFSVKELIARIRAVLRRSGEAKLKYEDKQISINFAEMRVTCCGNNLKLTRKEFAVLEALAKNPNSLATRQKLLNEVWGYNYFGDSRTLDVHIRRLRQKLGECASRIETVVGVGYRFVGDN